MYFCNEDLKQGGKRAQRNHQTAHNLANSRKHKTNHNVMLHETQVQNINTHSASIHTLTHTHIQRLHTHTHRQSHISTNTHIHRTQPPPSHTHPKTETDAHLEVRDGAPLEEGPEVALLHQLHHHVDGRVVAHDAQEADHVVAVDVPVGSERGPVGASRPR